MRTIYLIRHAHPDFPLGAHMCLGRTDTPLGPLGRMQACLLGEVLGSASIAAVFSSPLLRCRETAAPLGLTPILVDALAEQDMGPWDGLDFDAIRAGWPALYAQRASRPLLVPTGAETLEQVRRRVLPALRRCLADSAGDIAIVAHASVIQAVLAELTGTALEESRDLRPPYTGYARILEEGGALRPEQRALLPRAPLTAELAEKLLAAAAPGDRIAAHCRAVASTALRIAEALPLPLDRELLYAAALLHDIARREPDHGRLGAAWLRELGFDAAAALVEQHHDLQSSQIDEAAVLFLADKRTREDRIVSLEERFAESEKKCVSAQARATHAARLAQALDIQQKVEALCGGTVPLCV